VYLPRFDHGNRSFEALLDMSHLVDCKKFTPSMLPASNHASLHADPGQLTQLLAKDYPFPPKEREEIAEVIHLGLSGRTAQGWAPLDTQLTASVREWG